MSVDFQRNLRHTLFNPLSANPTKWSNTLKQFVGKLPTNGLSVFDHFVGLALKGLRRFYAEKKPFHTTPALLCKTSKTILLKIEKKGGCSYLYLHANLFHRLFVKL